MQASAGNDKPTLVFVSTRFLLPADSGGKIRTGHILKGLMRLGKFNIRLVSAATDQQVSDYRVQLQQICNEFVWWQAEAPPSSFSKARYLFSREPIPVRTDWSVAGAGKVAAALEDHPAVVVFDFLHSAILAPDTLSCASVLFTHNVETEIFRRHREVARTPAHKLLWQNQHRKMDRFEREAVQRFDVLVAVSERDGAAFRERYGVDDPHLIPTGVDLEYFTYGRDPAGAAVVFCGSMDWLANQDGVRFFLREVWSRVAAQVPDAHMTVVGRAPPNWLVEEARNLGVNWRFTGFVDDVRPFLRDATVAVIPLRVGGGTRLKVFEAMAIGCPVVSTSLGVEGLELTPGKHYMLADEPEEFSAAICQLLTTNDLNTRLSEAAREYVEQHCSFDVSAKRFQAACERAMAKRQNAARGKLEHTRA